MSPTLGLVTLMLIAGVVSLRGLSSGKTATKPTASHGHSTPSGKQPPREIEAPSMLVVVVGVVILTFLGVWLVMPADKFPAIHFLGLVLVIVILGSVVLGVGKAVDAVATTDTPYLIAVVLAVAVWVLGAGYLLLRPVF